MGWHFYPLSAVLAFWQKKSPSPVFNLRPSLGTLFGQEDAPRGKILMRADLLWAAWHQEKESDDEKIY